MAVPATATTNVQNVTITGSKTVYVGNTIELDSHVSPGSLDLRDSDYTWSSSNSSVAKVLKVSTSTVTKKICQRGCRTKMRQPLKISYCCIRI